jgi:hypothetical protein
VQEPGGQAADNQHADEGCADEGCADQGCADQGCADQGGSQQEEKPCDTDSAEQEEGARRTMPTGPTLAS